MSFTYTYQGIAIAIVLSFAGIFGGVGGFFFTLILSIIGGLAGAGLEGRIHFGDFIPKISFKGRRQ